MAFPFAERRNAVVGRCLDAVVRRPARAGARAGGPDLSRLVVGRRERRRRRRAVRPAHSPGPAQGTAFMWLAFAAATSYLVLARRQHLPHRTRNAILLYAGAVGVSALRVAAGKHFPTDVAAGAALGSGIGWLSATVHPTSP